MKKPSKKKNLAEIIKPYENKWVALSPDESAVVSSGDTMQEAESNVNPKELEEVIFMKVPPSDRTFLGSPR